MTNLSVALRMCVCGVATAWPFALAAQSGGKGTSSATTSVFNGQLADGTGVTLIINGTQLSAIPTSNACGRPYYLSGIIKFGTEGADIGTMSGTMLRCTNPELTAKCHQKVFYPVNFDATYQLDPSRSTRTLRITITHYPRQIWNKTDCKLFKTDSGQDLLIVSEAAPASADGTPSKAQQTINNVKQTMFNSFWDPKHTLH
jgi:hypothetical protein